MPIAAAAVENVKSERQQQQKLAAVDNGERKESEVAGNKFFQNLSELLQAESDDRDQSFNDALLEVQQDDEEEEGEGDKVYGQVHEGEQKQEEQEADEKLVADEEANNDEDLPMPVERTRTIERLRSIKLRKPSSNKFKLHEGNDFKDDEGTGNNIFRTSSLPQQPCITTATTRTTNTHIAEECASQQQRANQTEKIEDRALARRRNTSDIQLPKHHYDADAIAHDVMILDGVFVPFCTQRISWDFFVMVLVIYSVIVIPYRICFDQPAVDDMMVLELCMDGFFFLDIILNFNTATLSKEILITARRIIAKRYISSWFIVDLLSTLPIGPMADVALGNGIEGGSQSGFEMIQFIRLLKLLKLVRLFKLKKLSSSLQQTVSISPALQRLASLMCQIVFIAHLLACFWYFIADFDDTSQRNSWLMLKGTINKPILSQYIVALHWTIATLMSVGYGDIYAVNEHEMLFSIFTQVIGAASFGFIIANVTAFIETADPRASAYSRRMDGLKEYLRDRHLPPSLGKRVKIYYEHVISRQSIFDDLTILDQLPPHLRDKIVLHMHGQTARRIVMLKDEQTPFVAYIMARTKVMLSYSQEVIAEQDTVAKQVFIVIKGRVVSVCDESTAGARSTNTSSRLAKARKLAVRQAAAAAAPVSGFVNGRFRSRKKVNAQKGEDNPEIRTRLTEIDNEMDTLETIAGIYTDGTHFGEIAVLGNTCHLITYLSASTCDILTIDKADFEYALFLFTNSATTVTTYSKTHLMLQEESLKSETICQRGVRRHKRKILLDGCKLGGKSDIMRILGVQFMTSIPPSANAAASEALAQARQAVLADSKWSVVKAVELISKADKTKQDKIQKNSITFSGRTSKGSIRTGRSQSLMLDTPRFDVRSILVRQDIIKKSVRLWPKKQSVIALNRVVPLITDKFDMKSPEGFVEKKESFTQVGIASGESINRKKSLNLIKSMSYNTSSRNRSMNMVNDIKSVNSNHNNNSKPMLTVQHSESFPTNNDNIYNNCNNINNYNNQRPNLVRDPLIDMGGNKLPSHFIGTEEVEIAMTDIAARWIAVPTHAQKLQWDLFVAGLILYSVITVPFQLAFGVVPDAGWQLFDYIVDCLFFVDILISFRTAYTFGEDTVLVISPRLIRRHYLLGWFPIDIISTLPLEEIFNLFVSAGEAGSSAILAVKLVRSLRMVKLLKLFRLLKLKKLLGGIDEFIVLSPALLKLSGLLLNVSFVAHIFACVWYYIGTEAEDPRESWFADRQYLSPTTSDFEKYVTSYYYIFTTIATVGYGDVVPVNDSEMIFAIIITMAGATLFGYVVGSIATLVAMMDLGEELFKAKMSELGEYMKEQGVPKQLRKECKKCYAFSLGRKSVFDEGEMLDALSPWLRQQVVCYVNQEVIRTVPIFRDTSLAFISDILRIMHPQLALSGSQIVRRGELGSQLFFIIRGGVSVYQAKEGCAGVKPRSSLWDAQNNNMNNCEHNNDESEELGYQLVDGHFFGYEALLSSSPSKNTVRAAITTQMYVLVKSEIGRIVDTLPALAEQLQAVLRVAIAKQNQELSIGMYAKDKASQSSSSWIKVQNNLSVIGKMPQNEGNRNRDKERRNSLFASPLIESNKTRFDVSGLLQEAQSGALNMPSVNVNAILALDCVSSRTIRTSKQLTSLDEDDE